MNTNQTTLISLAMLKINIDNGRDYLEYLRPFILDIINELKSKIIDDEIVTKKLLSSFGLEIPKRTVNLLLQRIQRSGVISKKDGYYTVTVELVPATNIQRDKASAGRHISSVITGLIEYFDEYTQSKHEFSEEIAINSLLSFLSKFSIPCLKAYLRGTTIPHIPNGKDWKFVLVSQYIQYIHAHNPERFESFIALAQGNMLANALLCPDLQYATKSYSDVTFYFDTPLLLQLLGFEGEPWKQAVQELLQLIFKLNGKVACFTHTREELETVIKKSSEYIVLANGKGKIILEARRQGITKSDFLLLLEKIDDYLDEFNISIIKTPSYNNFNLQINEEFFSKCLDDEVSYHNPKAREYDINSVRSIYVIRNRYYPRTIEKCKAVLVTSNTAFSKAAYEFGKNHNESKEISSVITDFSLANTAWLKAPQGAPTLPQKEVLAFAYAGLNPTPDFWEKVLEESEKLEKEHKISPRDHQLLRSSSLIQEELMRLTLGEDDALNTQTITDTVRRITEEIKSEESLKIQEANKQHDFTKRELEQFKDKIDLLKENIFWNAENLSKKDANAIRIFLCFVIVIGVLSINGFINDNNLYIYFIKLFVTLLTIICFYKDGLTISGKYEKIKECFLKKRLNREQKKLGMKLWDDNTNQLDKMG